MDETYDAWAGRDERVFIHLPVERRILRDLPAGARILDLGCGDGSHIGLLATGGRVVVPLGDPGSTPHHLGQRPVADPFAI